jgi:hypothetical protein
MTLRIILAIMLLIPAAVGAQEENSIPLPFYMPVPDGWRTETIPFPLDFAPELNYEGLEELRFAPGMFDADSEDFWTYAFIWWIPEETSIDPDSLASDLEAYFSGLGHVVAKDRGLDTSGASYDVILAAADSDYDYKGEAKIFDSFVTGKMISLNIRVKKIACPDQVRLAVFFELSPQPYSQDVWATLAGIGEEFQCNR